MKNYFENIYRIDEEKVELVHEITKHYLDEMRRTSAEDMKYQAAIAHILFISEIYEFIEDKEEWDDVIYENMCRLKNALEEGEIVFGASLFDGMCDIAFAVSFLAKKIEYLKGFVDSLNDVILQECRLKLKEVRYLMDKIYFDHYDVISGLAGTAQYLLQFKDHEEVKELLGEICEYFVDITKKRRYKDKDLPGWYTYNHNEAARKDREVFPDGNLNLGLAHGIAGPMVILSKCFHEGIRVKGQEQAIESILQEYERFGIEDKYGVSHWYGKLPYHMYVNGTDGYQPYTRLSWCYGSIGISRALYITGKAMDNEKIVKMAEENLGKIADIKVEDYGVRSPIICHGFASMLPVFNIMYRETADEAFMKGVKTSFDAVIKMYKPESRYGFINEDITYEDGEKKLFSEENDNLLEGAPGIILCLIALFKNDMNFEKHFFMK